MKQNEKKRVDTIHSFFTNSIFIMLALPLLFLNWLLIDGKFGGGKAIIFVITAFLFGSFFFFD